MLEMEEEAKKEEEQKEEEKKVEVVEEEYEELKKIEARVGTQNPLSKRYVDDRGFAHIEGFGFRAIL